MKISRIRRLIAKKIDKEFIVFDTEKGRVFELNPTAELIWKSLSGWIEINELVRKIQREFAVKKTKVEKDVNAFVKKYSNKLFLLKN